MEITYSPHAKKRLRERNIHKSEITLVLAKPDSKVYSGRNRIIVNKKFKQHILEVIYVIESGKIIIITTYYL